MHPLHPPLCPRLVSVLVSVLKVSSLVLVSKFSGLETLNFAKKCWLKFLSFNDFLFVVFAGKKNPNTSETCQKFEKNWSQKWWRHFLTKFQQNAQIFKSRSRIQVSTLVVGVFDRVSVSSRNFNRVSVSKVTVSTTSLMVGCNNDESIRGVGSMTVQAIL